jgi:hypothetical protein
MIVDTSGSRTTDAAVTATNVAAVDLDNMDLTGSAGNGVYAAGVGSLTLDGDSIADSGEDGVIATGTDTSEVSIESNTLTGQAGTAIELELGGTETGVVDGNTIGDPSIAGSGSTSGSGIDISVAAGTLSADVANNYVYSIAGANGISGESSGSGTLNATLTGNSVTDGGAGSLTGIAFAANDASTLCLAPTGNTSDATGSGADGMSVDQAGATSSFAIQSYSGGASDINAVEHLLGAGNSLTGGSGGGVPAFAQINPSNTAGFIDGSCGGGITSS